MPYHRFLCALCSHSGSFLLFDGKSRLYEVTSWVMLEKLHIYFFIALWLLNHKTQPIKFFMWNCLTNKIKYWIYGHKCLHDSRELNWISSKIQKMERNTSATVIRFFKCHFRDEKKNQFLSHVTCLRSSSNQHFAIKII